MIRTAIIGMGTIFDIHFQQLQLLQQVEICGVCDIQEEKRAKAPGIPFYTDYKQMLAQEKPDCVHICLPHDLHYPVSAYCAEQGCHVLCEKPLADSFENARRFIELEEKYPSQVLCLCLQNRYNPSFVHLKSLLESGEYGKRIAVRGQVAWARSQAYYQESPWRGDIRRAGSGVLFNQSIHTLDLMLQLMGPLKSVKASVSHFLDYGIQVEDTVSAAMEFANGCKGIFFGTVANACNQAVEIWVFAEKATFLLRGGELFIQDRDGDLSLLMQDEKADGEKFYYGSSHGLLIEQFYGAVEQGGQKYIHLHDGFAVMQLMDAMLQSGDGKKMELSC